MDKSAIVRTSFGVPRKTEKLVFPLPPAKVRQAALVMTPYGLIVICARQFVEFPYTPGVRPACTGRSSVLP